MCVCVCVCVYTHTPDIGRSMRDPVVHGWRSHRYFIAKKSLIILQTNSTVLVCYIAIYFSIYMTKEAYYIRMMLQKRRVMLLSHEWIRLACCWADVRLGICILRHMYTSFAMLQKRYVMPRTWVNLVSGVNESWRTQAARLGHVCGTVDTHTPTHIHTHTHA